MSVESDTQKVKANISNIYERKRAALYALSLYYSAEALNEFRRNQAQNKYWDNKTNQALKRVFSGAFDERNSVGWYLAHGVSYGVYLELANDRKHEAIRPTVQGLLDKFKSDVERIYKG